MHHSVVYSQIRAPQSLLSPNEVKTKEVGVLGDTCNFQNVPSCIFSVFEYHHFWETGCVLCCAVRSRSVVFDAFPWTIAVACKIRLSTGVLQARILEWVAMPSSRGSSQPRDRTPGLPHCRWILTD